MRGLAVRLLLALVLVVSTAQGFVAQTHVHSSAAARAVPATGHVTAAVDALGREDVRCVLCDVAGHTPAVAPPAPPPSLFLSPLRAATAPWPTALTPDSLASHHWRGRGPPAA